MASELDKLSTAENMDARGRVFTMMKQWYRSVPRQALRHSSEASVNAKLRDFEKCCRPLEDVLADREVRLSELLLFLAIFGQKLEARYREAK